MLATILVDSPLDTIDEDGVTTLREAIADANEDAVADTIKFASSLNGETINLSSALPTITESVTIIGEDENDSPVDIAVDGQNSRRVFNIRLSPQSGETQTVTLENLIIQNGSTSGDGGGVNFTLGNSTTTNATAELQIINSTIKDSFAGGAGGGTDGEVGNGDGDRVFNIDLDPGNGETQEVTLKGLTITGGDVDAEGGGIKFHGDSSETGSSVKLSIIESNISGNYSHDELSGGGGLHAKLLGDTGNAANASLYIKDSIVSGNSSETKGGAMRTVYSLAA